MNTDDDRVLRAWLREGADQAPERFVWAALDEVEQVPQRRPIVAALDGLFVRLRPAAGVVGVAAVVALAVGAYLLFGGRGVSDTGGRAFTIADLETIVVWEDTKPPGWTLDSLITTSAEVALIPVRSARGDDLLAKVPDGYVGGRYTDFTGRPDAAFISWAALFETASDAEAAMGFYIDEMESPDAWGLGPGQPVPLGDGGMVFTGETRVLVRDAPGDPVPMRLYLWRVGNLLLATGAWFDYDPEEFRSVAAGMDARAAAR